MKNLIDYLIKRAKRGYQESFDSLNDTCSIAYHAQATEDVHTVRHLVKDVLKDKDALQGIDLELGFMDENADLGLDNANMKEFYQSLDSLKDSAEIAVMNAEIDQD